jgi:D-tyrosyl-tRNA(Tyr) deacylase
MRVVLQRVSLASVTVSGEVAGAIGPGLVVLVGVARDDGERDADYLADKVINLRVFPDDEGRMNRSLLETGGELLVISQFTLYGDCRKGRRPDFTSAAPPDEARHLYDYFVRALRERCNIRIITGVFQAEMDVSLTNRGPVTVICDSKKRPVKSRAASAG